MEPDTEPLTEDELGVLASRFPPSSIATLRNVAHPSPLYRAAIDEIKLQEEAGNSSNYGAAHCTWIDRFYDDTINSVFTIKYGDMEVIFHAKVNLVIYRDLDDIISAIKGSKNRTTSYYLGKGLPLFYDDGIVQLEVAREGNIIMVNLSGDTLQVFIDYLQHFYFYQQKQKEIARIIEKKNLA